MERGLIFTEAVADLQGFADLVADAIIRRTQPLRDDISTREARAAYGRGWLEDMVRKGAVHPTPVGGRVVYSRQELDAARSVDRAMGRLTTKHTNICQ